MLAKRIIPCLDVKNGQVVKGVQFQNHEIVGDILQLAKFYTEQGADELVFYDITASCQPHNHLMHWVQEIAAIIDIPFCVAGGIRTLQQAEAILNAGADKISINSPALENPLFIEQLAKQFGQQCVVVGIDSLLIDGHYQVWQYTGDPNKSHFSQRKTLEWIKEVENRGAGEIVLNCMNQDGMRKGYDLTQLKMAQTTTTLPLIASGGAGSMDDFANVFFQTEVSGALAASVFHKNLIQIGTLKAFLADQGCIIRREG